MMAAKYVTAQHLEHWVLTFANIKLNQLNQKNATGWFV